MEKGIDDKGESSFVQNSAKAEKYKRKFES